jgi:hypothetical protein
MCNFNPMFFLFLHFDNHAFQEGISWIFSTFSIEKVTMRHNYSLSFVITHA